MLISLVPREGVRRAGKGGWQGGGLRTNSAPCPRCPAPGGSVQDQALCCRLPPGGLPGGSRDRARRESWKQNGLKPAMCMELLLAQGLHLIPSTPAL